MSFSRNFTFRHNIFPKYDGKYFRNFPGCNLGICGCNPRKTEKKLVDFWQNLWRKYDENMTKIFSKFFLGILFQSEFCFLKAFYFFGETTFSESEKKVFFGIPKFRRFWQNFSKICQIWHFREILENFGEICIKFTKLLLTCNIFSRKIVFFQHVFHIILFTHAVFRQNFYNLAKTLGGFHIGSKNFCDFLRFWYFLSKAC